MAGVMNNSARQYNLRALGRKGEKVLVRLAPGFNIVNDKHWDAFVREDHINEFVEELKNDGLIEFGDEMDEKQLEVDPDTKSKSKSEPATPPQKGDDKKDSKEPENEKKTSEQDNVAKRNGNGRRLANK